MNLVQRGDGADHVAGARFLFSTGSHRAAPTLPLSRINRAADLPAQAAKVLSKDFALFHPPLPARRLAARRKDRRASPVCAPAERPFRAVAAIVRSMSPAEFAASRGHRSWALRSLRRAPLRSL